MEKIRLHIELIKDIHYVWDQLESIEQDATNTFIDSTKDILKIGGYFDVLGIPLNKRTKAIKALGMVEALNLIAWITTLRKQGVTLKKFLRDNKDVIEQYGDNEYIKRYIIERNIDVFYP